MPARGWDDGISYSGLGAVFAAVRSRYRVRVAARRHVPARADSAEADAPQGAHRQLGTVNTDPHRHDPHMVSHTANDRWVGVPCSGGCGNLLSVYGDVWVNVWTCPTCSAAPWAGPTLRVIEGGRQAGDTGGPRPSDIGGRCV